jgi:cell division protein DivIC
MPLLDPKLIEKLPPLLRNKFFLVLFPYFIYLLFFSQNNLIAQFRLARQVRELSQQEAYYTKEIAAIEQEQHKIFSDIGEMERYAREQYWMKRDSEDLFIFVPEPEK